MPDKTAHMKNSAKKTAGRRLLTPNNAEPPFHFYPSSPMELFAPDRHLALLPRTRAAQPDAAASFPLSVAARLHPKRLLIPRDEDCRDLWDQYAMLDNIRAHSVLVADMAHAVGLEARKQGIDVSLDALLAAGLLHDLGKTYTIAHGGSHAQLGASWVMRDTRNGPIARAVLFHVHWPWPEKWLDDDRLLLTAITLYADKRVKHDAFVSLDARFEDLLERYGVNEYARERIKASHLQGKHVEAALSRRLGVDLHECVADSGRLVKRT